MKRSSKYGLKIFFLAPILFVILLFLLLGCEKINAPQEEGITGVYQSVNYSQEDLQRLDIVQTYDLKLELLQRGNIITGQITDLQSSEKFELKGTIEYNYELETNRIQLKFAYGGLDLFENGWINDKEKFATYPYQFIGQCIYYSGARAIRFKKTGELHNQGKIF